MDFTNQAIAILGSVLLVAVLASAVTRRMGMPLLLAVLVIGMLLGEDGIAGFHFDNVPLAFMVGNLALAIILFDGGLNTDAASFRVGLKPALSLATLGVVLTTAVTAVIAKAVLDLTWLEALLAGAIVGSTDAAAVFGVLRSKGLRLKQRVAATLEIESGSNDPMAIFMTLVLVNALAAQQAALEFGVIWTFIVQMGAGALLGLAGGRALSAVINSVPIDASLYPLVALAGGLTIFGITALLGGSGFLAVYLAGLVLGNRPLRSRASIRSFHDGSAWLAQIGMFLVLGLLVTPSELVADLAPVTVLALGLMLVARPVAVALSLLPFRMPWREQVFISWVGLRGAVPIVLSLFPLMAGIEHASIFFNVAFVVVLVSLFVQGWTVAPLARWGRLELPSHDGALQRVELDIPGRFDLELVCYRVQPDSCAVSRRLSDLGLPEGAKIGFVIRDCDVLRTAEIAAGDLVYVLAPPVAIGALDQIFAAGEAACQDEMRFFGEFVLSGDARLGDLTAVYGIGLPAEHADATLAGVLRARFAGKPVVGDLIRVGAIELVVREMDGAEITKVGLKIAHRGP